MVRASKFLESLPDQIFRMSERISGPRSRLRPFFSNEQTEKSQTSVRNGVALSAGYDCNIVACPPRKWGRPVAPGRRFGIKEEVDGLNARAVRGGKEAIEPCFGSAAHAPQKREAPPGHVAEEVFRVRKPPNRRPRARAWPNTAKQTFSMY